jgi:FKBP-type peptidyl-prolyl cis-trans isomerase SlyD
MAKQSAVSDNMVVSLAYTLTLADGEIADEADQDDPLQFLQGWGEIIPGLEKALYGMTVGQEKDIVVAPADGYGDPDPDEVELVPRDAFPNDIVLEPGMLIYMGDEDSDDVYEAEVVEVRRDGVVLNFNHPLAGETLYFHVKVVDLRLATPEELDHGHVHDDDDEE